MTRADEVLCELSGLERAILHHKWAYTPDAKQPASDHSFERWVGLGILQKVPSPLPHGVVTLYGLTPFGREVVRALGEVERAKAALDGPE